MEVNLIQKNSSFLFDKEGVIILTDIEKTDVVVRGELIYDGKNVAILNRNNKDFFVLKNIAPLIREKIKQAQYVTIIERDQNTIYSYQVEVHLKDDLGFEDDFEEFAEKVMSEIQKKLSVEDFEKFLSEAEKFIQEGNG